MQLWLLQFIPTKSVECECPENLGVFSQVESAIVYAERKYPIAIMEKSTDGNEWFYLADYYMLNITPVELNPFIGLTK